MGRRSPVSARNTAKLGARKKPATTGWVPRVRRGHAGTGTTPGLVEGRGRRFRFGGSASRPGRHTHAAPRLSATPMPGAILQHSE